MFGGFLNCAKCEKRHDQLAVGITRTTEDIRALGGTQPLIDGRLAPLWRLTPAEAVNKSTIGKRIIKLKRKLQSFVNTSPQCEDCRFLY